MPDSSSYAGTNRFKFTGLGLAISAIPATWPGRTPERGKYTGRGESRGKVVSGQAAAHRQGGRCFAPTSLGLLGSVARRGTHFAPKAAPFKQPRRVS